MRDETENHLICRRINKAIGQCNGIARMTKEGDPCEKILLQVSAAKNAIHQAGQCLLESYIADFLRTNLNKTGVDVEEAITEFTRTIEFFCRMRK